MKSIPQDPLADERDRTDLLLPDREDQLDLMTDQTLRNVECALRAEHQALMLSAVVPMTTIAVLADAAAKLRAIRLERHDYVASLAEEG
jgi:hypothetical protein